MNTANLRIGNEVYERLLGFCPRVALVNEQAYSAGLVRHYLDAGYRAIVMEWDNPARFHPEWHAEWRYLPQRAVGVRGEEIELLWNNSVAFQRFQRYAHGELELEELLQYLGSHAAETRRALPLYVGDAEVFDFRPGRYATETPLVEGEWARVGELFAALLADDCFDLVRPSDALALRDRPGAGNRLRLETPEQPVPVKKQEKYNLTRWAVSGRADLAVNTTCARLARQLAAAGAADADWKELCYLWSSDFRTHITERRWTSFRRRLAAFEARVDRPRRGRRAAPAAAPAVVQRNGRFLTVESETVRLQLNVRRGLAVQSLAFPEIAEEPLAGTLEHGHFDDIALVADFYTGHLVLERPGCPKVTDLEPVEVEVAYEPGAVVLAGSVETPLGAIDKRIRVVHAESRVEIEYLLDWPELPIGSLRLGHVTLDPRAFDRSALVYTAANGGSEPERFSLNGNRVRHGAAVSSLVSATHGLGLTDGVVELGDERRRLRVEVDRETAALIGLVTYRPAGESFFYRLSLSARETDETCRPLEREPGSGPFAFRLALTPA